MNEEKKTKEEEVGGAATATATATATISPEKEVANERREYAKPFLDALYVEKFPKTSIQLPGDTNYETNRNYHFNLDVICHPLLFVQPSTSEEVAMVVRAYATALQVWKKKKQQEQEECVVAATDNNNDDDDDDDGVGQGEVLPLLCIAAGRHSTRSMKDGAVILDLSLMQNVKVDIDNQTITVEGGVKIGKMIDALAPYGLAPVTGTHADTGVMGLTLGGGQGYLGKKYGPAIDQIISAEVVLADGTIREVNINNPNDSDILFNLRGGGGNICVVTKLTSKVYPIKNAATLELVHFVLTQNGTKNLIMNYGNWSLNSPPECVSFCILPLGKPIVVVMGISCDTSVIPQDNTENKPSSATATATAATIDSSKIPGLSELKQHRLGGLFRLKDEFKVKDFHKELIATLSNDKPAFYYYTNMLLPSLTSEISFVLAEAQRSKGKGLDGAIIIFNHAGNKMEEVSPTDTAFEMRHAKYWIFTQLTWKTTGNQEHDAIGREKVQQFNHWFRGALLNAGARGTIHPVADMDQTYDETSSSTSKTEYGQFIQERNREKIISYQNELDPNGIFKANRAI